MNDLEQDFVELRDRISNYSSVGNCISMRDELIIQRDDLLRIVHDLLNALDEKEKTITKIRFALKAFMVNLEPSEYNKDKTKEMLKMDIFSIFDFYGIDLNKFMKGEKNVFWY